jgi:hypothetical protein
MNTGDLQECDDGSAGYGIQHTGLMENAGSKRCVCSTVYSVHYRVQYECTRAVADPSCCLTL